MRALPPARPIASRSRAGRQRRQRQQAASESDGGPGAGSGGASGDVYPGPLGLTATEYASPALWELAGP